MSWACEDAMCYVCSAQALEADFKVPFLHRFPNLPQVWAFTDKRISTPGKIIANLASFLGTGKPGTQFRVRVGILQPAECL